MIEEGCGKMSSSVVFDKIDNLIYYLYEKHGKLTPIKLQKGLYFLYAYYGATYGETDETEGVLEQDYKDLPSRLFEANFEAWTYGPVIRDVWKKQKEGKYDGEIRHTDSGDVKLEVTMFIDELFQQINSISDFSLVDRSHEDEVWKLAYDKGPSTPLDNNQLVKEYQERYIV